MTDTPETITQRTPIRDVMAQLRGTAPVIVQPEDSLHHLAEEAVENPRCRVMSVADGGRLVGIVPVRLLVNDVFLKVVPEEYLAEITDLDAVMQYAEHIGARTAGDIMLDPVSVRSDETVRDAFEKMYHSRLNGLPVADVNGRVEGYLDQLELLWVWLHATGRQPLLRPPSEPGAEAGR